MTTYTEIPTTELHSTNSFFFRSVVFKIHLLLNFIRNVCKKKKYSRPRIKHSNRIMMARKLVFGQQDFGAISVEHSPIKPLEGFSC